METVWLKEILETRGYGTVRILGRGAFSTVFLTRSRTTGRLWACKASENGELLEREGELLARIRHPLFPRFHAAWAQSGVTFLFLEYVCGNNLEELLKRRGRFGSAQTARAGMELAEGLHYLHQMPRPMVFRDVKPANVMIRQDGRVRLLDLGCVCTLEEAGRTRAGTPGFAAPEQLNGTGRLTAACDVYGLGKTLESMAGRRAGKGLQQVIRGCTGAQPEKRYPDMRAVISALAQWSGDGNRIRRGNAGLPGRAKAVCVENLWESMYKNS